MSTKVKPGPEPVKLICGLIYREIAIFQKAISRLEKAFGKIDGESEIYPFNHTEYYQSEMGRDLTRKFISFEKLIHPGKLAEVKTKTNLIEQELSEKREDEVCRRINIDPGYLELSKLVLASTKNFAHRIYLDKGIYAEVTLVFRESKFKYLPWTYPDYVDPRALEFFEHVRQIYKCQK